MLHATESNHINSLEKSTQPESLYEEEGKTTEKHLEKSPLIAAEPIVIEVLQTVSHASKKRKVTKVSGFDLAQALNDHPMGFCVYNHYNQHGYLGEYQVGLLLDIIIFSCYKLYG